MRIVLSAKSILLIAIACVPVASEARGESPAADAVLSLIDGKTLDGWVVENGAVVEVKDGALLFKDGDGWLRSHHAYGDCKVHVEWKALKDDAYDAGVYLRASAEGKPFPRSGYQANMLKGKEGNIGNLPGATSTGLIKPGDWNTFDITAVGETIEMVINGKPAWKVAGATIPRGHVGLQVEVPKGGQFLVRSFVVTELGFKPMFNGKDFTGWEGADQPADKCWAVEEGLLVCKMSKGPWLRSLEEHGDFNFRFDYQLGEGANSGVYVRVPKDGNHHREDDTKPPAGFEVQVIDDGAPQYAKLKDYQYSASVYDIAGADPRVTKPAGQWNTLEINCRGQNVTTIHNGVVVTRVTPETHPLIKLREVKGFLGLQNHGGGVAFRNLRLGPATE